MTDKIFVILSFALFVKTIEWALCVFKDLQKRFKEFHVFFKGLQTTNLAKFACKIST